MVGNDKGDCGKDPYVKPICCKSSTAPKTCTWRGGGSDCNGQCHKGEVTLFESKKGGRPESESRTKECTRGNKVFCCTDERFTDLTSTCSWTKCGVKSCKDGEVSVAYAENLGGRCDSWSGYGMNFCCNSNAKPLDNCHWVGRGDCADNTCNNKETVLAVDTYGDNYGGKACNWGRKPTLCCTPNLDVLAPATCEKTLCNFDSSVRCGADPYADDSDDQDDCDSETEVCFDAVSRRDDWSPAISSPVEHSLQKRGQREPLQAKLTDLLANYLLFDIISRFYPGSTQLHAPTAGSPASSRAYRLVGGGCDSTAIEDVDASTLSRLERLGSDSGGFGPGYDTEHNPDLQYARDLLETVTSGVLPDSGQTHTQSILISDIQAAWYQALPANTFPRAGPGARDLNVPNHYLMDQFGSRTNRSPLLLTHRPINLMKGRIFNSQATPQALRTFQDNLNIAINAGTGEDALLQPIREVISVFRYINDPSVLLRIQSNRRALRTATQHISAAVPALRRLHDIHLEFDNNWYHSATQEARDWVLARMDEIQIRYHLAEQRGATIANSNRVQAALRSFWNDLEHVTPPPDL
ncbi:hypothetical protein PT974_07398 [Cladobotryum mycophilum]|uniref:Uncharacterized protein n=1 Tax=Cladobotryum mycophilum TaxID=491253 RepID=A0ABR0SQE1_9HYPO